MIFKTLLNKLLFLIGVKSYRWKLAICEIQNNKVKILKIFDPGFFEFWADPFLIINKNKKYIFYECYNYLSKKGEIQCFEYKKNLVLKKKSILSKNYHLSYPHIFKFKNKFYLIPESFESNKTSIYESVKFPYQWKKVKTIFKGNKVCDTTVFYKNKKFWLFVNKAKVHLDEFNKKLFIYSSKNIKFDKLTPHSKNPVINSLENGRNAGSIYFKDNSFYRPSQINKKDTYGYGFSINKITKLSNEKYNQLEILRITPKNFNNKNICGVHHYNRISDKIFLTDLCFRFSF